MSNHLAIATVTQTLRYSLERVAQEGEEFTNPQVEAGRPKKMETEDSQGIRIFLYNVSPNEAFRNADLPTRRADGTVSDRPQSPLNLHYLLSFYGNENRLEAQRLLGRVTRFMHSRPLLTRDMIEEAISGVDYLQGSDLAYQVEKVKFSPMPLSLEELSKLWSGFFEAPYLLSVAYSASVVLIEAEDTPGPALPVRDRNVYVKPFRNPQIEAITSQPPPAVASPPEFIWADEPILAGHTLIVTGTRLRGEITRVRIGGADVDPASVSDTRITLPLTSPPCPNQALRAGVQSLQIVHDHSMGSPPVPHRGVESELAPFVLRPSFTSNDVEVVDIVVDPDNQITRKQVQVTVTPNVGRKQRTALFLNERDPIPGREPCAYRFDGEKDNGIMGEGIEETDTLPFFISDQEGKHLVELGLEYLARVQVDGAESPLLINEQGNYREPVKLIQ